MISGVYILSFLFFIIGCGPPKPPSKKASSSEFTIVEQAALDAFNTLQISTDERNRLYSTFPGIEHACYPPDTIFTLSQSQFTTAMNKFVRTYCKNLPLPQQDMLISTCVLAQENYTISLCSKGSSIDFMNDSFPMSGIWIIPKVLNTRDVIIKWD